VDYVSYFLVLHRITKDTDGMYSVHYESEAGESCVRVGLVMFGTGRKPNTRNIGLEVGSSCKHAYHLALVHDAIPGASCQRQGIGTHLIGAAGREGLC
jgi:hypothetical protein